MSCTVRKIEFPLWILDFFAKHKYRLLSTQYTYRLPSTQYKYRLPSTL